MNILTEIKAHKQVEVAELKRRGAEAIFKAACRQLPPPRDFIGALAARRDLGKAAVIAEIKRKSPSKGIIREDFDVAVIAAAMGKGDAACLSVLTDETFFGGRPEFVAIARAASGLPILRKDFLIDPIQVVEARAMQADAVLLILALLEDQQARELKVAAESHGMQVLIEIHNEAELNRALAMNARLIGINNRDLTNFEADLAVSQRLACKLGVDRLVISESGISQVEDVQRLLAFGVDGFLIGEALMKAADIKAATQAFTRTSLINANRSPRELICE